VAAVQAQRAAQRRAGDNLERSFSLTSRKDGTFGYKLRLEPGTERSVPIAYTSTGGGHLHTVGGGDTLSRGGDVTSYFNKGDVDFALEAFDKFKARGDDVSRIVTILGAENGKVIAWRGRNLKGKGTVIGVDTCD
jgi:hypothetical protein